MFIRCLQCNWIGMPKETKEDGQCPHCSCTGYLMELDSDSSFTDYDLEQLWDAFGDTAMNPETERIEEKFMGWGPGIHREEIWHWFDERYSKGVYFLAYGSLS